MGKPGTFASRQATSPITCLSGHATRPGDASCERSAMERPDGCSRWSTTSDTKWRTAVFDGSQRCDRCGLSCRLDAAAGWSRSRWRARASSDTIAEIETLRFRNEAGRKWQEGLGGRMPPNDHSACGVGLHDVPKVRQPRFSKIRHEFVAGAGCPSTKRERLAGDGRGGGGPPARACSRTYSCRHLQAPDRAPPASSPRSGRDSGWQASVDRAPVVVRLEGNHRPTCWRRRSGPRPARHVEPALVAGLAKAAPLRRCGRRFRHPARRAA